MPEVKQYRVVGLMSGTSLDGLDIALCSFVKKDAWEYSIEAAATISYPDAWLSRISGIHRQSGEQLQQLHVAYGRFLGETVREFLSGHSVTADFVASHGHTVFHQPAAGFTFQAGCGATLAAVSGLPVVHDFRTADVALGGQGAPLVPIGDRLLFGNYAACLNLGGIANISFEKDSRRIAFDVSPCNLLLNHLAEREGKSYDEGGAMAAAGNRNEELLLRLEELPYYGLAYPKSLGREDIERTFLPLLTSDHSTKDLLRTVADHIAHRIAATCRSLGANSTVLVTGGGAFNTYLMEQLRKECPAIIVIPEASIVQFKEALVFAFLGLLRWRGEVNVLSSVTGARKDHCAGSISLPV